jgi:hypothetical protein
VVSGSDIVSYAKTQLGDPYEWGAEGPDAFDCSGLVQYVYKHFGLSTPRTTYDMIGSDRLQKIQKKDLQPGDLIFSNWIGRTSSHVGIYAGNDQIIEAPEKGKDVMVTKLGPGYWSHVDGYRRVPGVDGSAVSHGNGAGSVSTGDALSTALQVATPFGSIGSLIAAPGNVTGALTNIGTAMAGVASSAAEVGKLANVASKAFLPSNILRGMFLVSGFVCILIGIWFLASEIKD